MAKVRAPPRPLLPGVGPYARLLPLVRPGWTIQIQTWMYGADGEGLKGRALPSERQVQPPLRQTLLALTPP